MCLARWSSSVVSFAEPSTYIERHPITAATSIASLKRTTSTGFQRTFEFETRQRVDLTQHIDSQLLPQRFVPNFNIANYVIPINLDWQSGILSYGNNGGGGNHSPLTAQNMTNRQGSASLTSLSDNDESSRKRQVRLLKNR
jgi:hypothetical protein